MHLLWKDGVDSEAVDCSRFPTSTAKVCMCVRRQQGVCVCVCVTRHPADWCFIFIAAECLQACLVSLTDICWMIKPFYLVPVAPPKKKKKKNSGLEWKSSAFNSQHWKITGNYGNALTLVLFQMYTCIFLPMITFCHLRHKLIIKWLTAIYIAKCFLFIYLKKKEKKKEVNEDFSCFTVKLKVISFGRYYRILWENFELKPTFHGQKHNVVQLSICIWWQWKRLIECHYS